MENKDQIASFDTGDESKFVDKHRSNVKSDLIEITEDKLENILLKHLKKNWHKKGLSKPEALREAQLALKRMPAYEHPFYWAPFVMIGDWLGDKATQN